MPHPTFSSQQVKYAVFTALTAFSLVWCSSPHSLAANTPASGEYLEFIQHQAAARWADAAPPTTVDEWRKQKEMIRQQLSKAWGGFPGEPCPLEPRKLGEIQRDGYRIEKIVFQTRPGVWMTANAYVPERPGKHPAILAVHGHWKGAKQDPVVQARCIGPVKLGFFVLVVDAFGSGERGIGKALGEYHGDMTGATLFPIGLPLSGLQVYENMRAVDYLRTRSEVDGDRIGITGASGGGNQTMYAGAWDERFNAVVPVCSVGTYQSYLGGGCCMCEVVPGALRFTEEWGVLGLTAPRGLMVVNATRDAFQFSVGEAKKSLARVEPIFQLYDKRSHVRHAIFESAHDYNRDMREAMYGWMAMHLRGEGDGSPIPDPEIKTEDPESLRCYPGSSRPDDWVTIPRFAAAEGRKLVAAKAMPKDAESCREVTASLRTALAEKVFGGFPTTPPDVRRLEETADERISFLHFQPEPGLNLKARVEYGNGTAPPLVVLVDLEGAEKAGTGALAKEVRRVGWTLVTLDLRATGKLARPNETIGRAPDHHSAEWGLWLGRPLLGQWTFDLQRLLDTLEWSYGRLPSEVIVIGSGPGGLVALSTGAVDKRITKIAAVGTLASFITEEPYEGQRLGVMAPGILRTVGDVASLAALNAPRRVVIAGGVAGNGKLLSHEELRSAYQRAAQVWEVLGAKEKLHLLEEGNAAEVLRALLL